MSQDKKTTKAESVPFAIEQLPGADKVIAWFGYFPDFHDGEVISLTLKRQETSVLRIYPYEPKKPATVEFMLEEVTDLSLEGFSHQNVLNGLLVEKAMTEEFGEVIRLTLGPCYGITGTIDAKKVSLNITPGSAPDGGSLW